MSRRDREFSGNRFPLGGTALRVRRARQATAVAVGLVVVVFAVVLAILHSADTPVPMGKSSDETQAISAGINRGNTIGARHEFTASERYTYCLQGADDEFVGENAVENYLTNCVRSSE